MSELVEIGPIAPKVVLLGLEELSADEAGKVAAAVAAAVTPDVPALRWEDVIDAALRLVTALTKATVGGADGVSVAVTRHGKLTTVAASDETIAQMDRDQYATGEGPCMAAAETLVPLRIPGR